MGNQHGGRRSIAAPGSDRIPHHRIEDFLLHLPQLLAEETHIDATVIGNVLPDFPDAILARSAKLPWNLNFLVSFHTNS